MNHNTLPNGNEIIFFQSAVIVIVLFEEKCVHSHCFYGEDSTVGGALKLSQLRDCNVTRKIGFSSSAI